MTAGASALLIALLASSGATAAETPIDLFVNGQFARAEQAGIAQNDAQGFAIAARSVLAEDMMRSEPCLDCLKHAEALARRAITSDPKQPEGHIYLAAAMGYRARIIGDLAAQSEGIAGKTRSELDAALADDPADAWALAAMGSWHMEIVRGAGSTMARWLFGARFSTGQDYYVKAFAIDPGNLVLHYQYALAMAACDLEGHQGEIESELERAATGTPDSAYAAFARNKAHELLDVVKRGDAAATIKLVRHDEGYPD